MDAPVQEQTEEYLAGFGLVDAPLAAWSVSEPRLELSPAAVVQLATQLPGGGFHVRQKGTHALSLPLLLGSLPL